MTESVTVKGTISDSIMECGDLSPLLLRVKKDSQPPRIAVGQP